ncbi:MAG: hypothetical protein JWO44_2642 [Bacteroidetes bacterium]|nr:hypothetical protein [Bacteroidota bacterium]
MLRKLNQNKKKESLKKCHFIKLLLSAFIFITGIASAQTKFIIYFDSNKSDLKKASLDLLDSLSAALQTKNNYKLNISGYCDTTGEVKRNQLLSEKRATIVADYLINKKLPSQLITAKGFADSNPITGKNDKSDARNRRVEIDLVFITPVPQPVQKAEKSSADDQWAKLANTPIVSPPPPVASIKTEILAEDIQKADLKPGKIFVVQNLNFYDASATLLPESKPALKRLLKLMKDNPTLEIEIEGHVCCQNDVDLSTDRALTVLEYLVSNSIEERRLKYAGHGNSFPIASDVTEEGRKQNRRVEIMILKY